MTFTTPTTSERIAHRHTAALLVVLLALLYMTPELVSRTLGLDGLVYANVAIALSADWNAWAQLPFYDAAAPVFTDHPPLGIWLLAAIYSVSGTGFLIEKLYSAVVAVALLGAVARYWQRVLQRHDSWWPLLLLVLMPVTTYTMRNNYLENTMTLCIVLGCSAAWCARTNTTRVLLTGTATACAIGIKGLPGCIPVLATWLAITLRDGSQRQALGQTALTGMVALLPWGFWLLANADARDYFSNYLQQQLLASIDGSRPIVHGRVYQSSNILLNTGIAAVLCLLMWRWQSLRNLSPATIRSAAWRYTTTLALISVAGLFVSSRHFRHYLSPAAPLIAMSLAALVQTRPQFEAQGKWQRKWQGKWQRKVLLTASGLSAVALLVAISLYVAVPGKAQPQIMQAAALAAGAPAASGFPSTVCVAADTDLRTLAYLYRTHRLRHLRTPHPACESGAQPDRIR